MMISIGDVPPTNPVPNTDWATGGLRVRPPRPSMRGTSIATRSRRFNSWSSSRSSGGMGAPQEMPPKRLCRMPPPDSFAAPPAFLAPRGAETPLKLSKIELDSGIFFPDSPLAARMFDSWQYLPEDDDADEMMTDRCSVPSLVLDPADLPESAASTMPTAIIEPIDSTQAMGMVGPDVPMAMDDEADDDDNSSVVSWDFWPRRTSLLSRNEDDEDDGDSDDHLSGDDNVRRHLLNVDRFMASLLLSDDSDDDVEDNLAE